MENTAQSFNINSAGSASVSASFKVLENDQPNTAVSPLNTAIDDEVLDVNIPQSDVSEEEERSQVAVDKGKKQVKISKLNDEELLIIFAKLNGPSLVSALEICQRWKYLIEGSPQLYRHFMLNLIDAFPLAREHYRKLKFERILIVSFDDDVDDVNSLAREILEFHRFNMKDIEVEYIARDIFENLWKLENLERIKIRDFYETPYRHKSRFMTFNRLKQLYLRSIHLEYFKVIAPNLEELKLVNCDEGIQLIKEFPKLRVFDCVFDVDSGYLEVVFDAIPQKLHTLKIKNESILNTINAMKLFESQRNNLKELKIITRTDRDEEVVYALSKMSVEKLKFSLRKKLTITERNDSIKNLILHVHTFERSSFLPTVMNILLSCPNVESFGYTHRSGDGQCYDFDVLTMVAQLPRIRHLTLKISLETFSCKIDLSSIMSLTIGLPYKLNFPALYNLLSSCENIKKLCSVGKFTAAKLSIEDLINILEKLPKLEELDLNYKSSPLSESLVDTLIKKKFTLKKLKLKDFYWYEDEVLKEQNELAVKLGREANIECILCSRQNDYLCDLIKMRVSVLKYLK